VRPKSGASIPWTGQIDRCYSYTQRPAEDPRDLTHKGPCGRGAGGRPGIRMIPTVGRGRGPRHDLPSRSRERLGLPGKLERALQVRRAHPKTCRWWTSRVELGKKKKKIKNATRRRSKTGAFRQAAAGPMRGSDPRRVDGRGRLVSVDFAATRALVHRSTTPLTQGFRGRQPGPRVLLRFIIFHEQRSAGFSEPPGYEGDLNPLHWRHRDRGFELTRLHHPAPWRSQAASAVWKEGRFLSFSTMGEGAPSRTSRLRDTIKETRRWFVRADINVPLRGRPESRRHPASRATAATLEPNLIKAAARLAVAVPSRRPKTGPPDPALPA